MVIFRQRGYSHIIIINIIEHRFILYAVETVINAILNKVREMLVLSPRDATDCPLRYPGTVTCKVDYLPGKETHCWPVNLMPTATSRVCQNDQVTANPGSQIM